MYHPEAADNIEHNCSYFLYTQVFGVHGHVPTSESYSEVIQSATLAAAEDMYYAIYLPPHAQDS